MITSFKTVFTRVFYFNRSQIEFHFYANSNLLKCLHHTQWNDFVGDNLNFYSQHTTGNFNPPQFILSSDVKLGEKLYYNSRHFFDKQPNNMLFFLIN